MLKNHQLMSRSGKACVWCKVPRTGLGNQLFVIIKAAVFAERNKLPLFYTGYNQIRIGPYLRREKSKRRYSHFFTFQKGIVSELLDRLKLMVIRLPIISDPDDLLSVTPDVLYKFSKIPHWSNYFVGLKSSRAQAIALFNSILTDDIKSAVEKQKTPVIGVHVRMGDFRQLAENEDFKYAAGAVRTPLNYFSNIITKIRLLHGKTLPVTIFSDGYDHELKELFDLGNVSRQQGNKDIVDLILLSRSKIIVASAASTFSYWAGFLSEAPLILHPYHIHESIRDSKDGLMEGIFDDTNIDLQNKIKAITIDE